MQNHTMRFQMQGDDRRRLEHFPWEVPLEEWPGKGVQLLLVRRGESRHPVVFVEAEGVRYAIKETTPRMAEREIRNLREIERRGIPTLTACGTVLVPAAPIALDIPKLGGVTQYMSGDRGYTVTRLAPRVVPHALLYRLPFTRKSKRRLLSAVGLLMIELHEHGVYWGDPSLANVLIRIDGQSILAIMADAETTELFSGAISDGLREQDLAMFGESLAWQAEDLRQARGLPEETQVIDDTDYKYFRQRYHWLRRQHAHIAPESNAAGLYQFERFLRQLNRWSFSILGTTGYAFHHVTTVLPGWFQRRIQELLHITVPRIYARRFYNLILGHQALLSKRSEQEYTLEEAAKHWYSHYHLPTILLLRRHLTADQDPMQAYFEIMDHKWDMSNKAGREIPLDEAVLDWSMHQARPSDLGAIDPAVMASWWHELEPSMEVLEPTMIESQELEPLLSTGEKPLVRLNQPDLEQKMSEMLDAHNNESAD